MKSLLALFVFSACALIGATTTATARNLDVADAKKLEIRHGQIGPRDTLIFYTMADDAAVLQLNITHKAGKFTMHGKMHLFAEGLDAKEIGKWINNQHSCGLFPDVPKPTASIALPANACAVTESKLKEGKEVQQGGTVAALAPDPNVKFQEYALKIKVNDLKMKGFSLKGFIAETSAFVKIGPEA